MAIQVLLHASELLKGAGIRRKGGRHPEEKDLGRVKDGAIVFEERGRILWVGPTSKLPAEYRRARRGLKIRDLESRHAVIPGMIDCHTHLVFAGDRSEEFALRCGGATYEEIAKRGGGIRTTVRATRAATLDQLEQLASPRVREAAAFGVRTLEIKSGYGLDLETELKQLEVVRRLQKRFPELTLVSTFLGAHAFPAEVSRAAYLKELVERMLPEVARRSLADACDVFIDRGYYTVKEGRQILERARALGLQVKVHADELANTESASFAADLGALSADHLLCVSRSGIRRLAASETTAVLLPGTAFYLNAAQAPARALLKAGARVALSTDFNPGTSMTLHLPAVLTIAALQLGMTRAELFAAVTYNAACALGLQARKGTLERGKDADVVVLPFEHFEEIYYRFAWAPPALS